MSHIEPIGEKSITMTLDAQDIERGRDGSMMVRSHSGSTPLLARLPREVADRIGKAPRRVILTGPARLHIRVNEDCSLTGTEILDVAEISVLAQARPDKTRAPVDIPY